MDNGATYFLLDTNSLPILQCPLSSITDTSEIDFLLLCLFWLSPVMGKVCIRTTVHYARIKAHKIPTVLYVPNLVSLTALNYCYFCIEDICKYQAIIGLRFQVRIPKYFINKYSRFQRKA
jgi:hypothetical protein